MYLYIPLSSELDQLCQYCLILILAVSTIIKTLDVVSSIIENSLLTDSLPIIIYFYLV